MPYEKGDGITLAMNVATTWKAGLKIGRVVAFDVTNQAKFSSSEKLQTTATARTRNFCGKNTYPGDFPARIVVKRT